MAIYPALPTRLYSPKQIGIASFLGSPAAAGWFFWRNEKSLGRPGTGAKWFWGLIAATVGVIALSFVLPEKFPPFIIPLAYSFALRAAAKNLYEMPLAQSLASGGEQGSWGAVIGVSVLALVLVIALIFGVVLLLPNQPD